MSQIAATPMTGVGETPAPGGETLGTTGQGDNVKLVRSTLLLQSLNAPEGVISVDCESHHTWRPFFVGRVRGDGLVEVVHASLKPIRPAPFPFSRTHEEWESFVKGLSSGRGGGRSPSGYDRPPGARTGSGRSE